MKVACSFQPRFRTRRAIRSAGPERTASASSLRIYKGHFEDHVAFDRQRHDRDWKNKRLLTEATFGWAITGHKSQGSQWENVIVWDDGLGRNDSIGALALHCYHPAPRGGLVKSCHDRPQRRLAAPGSVRPRRGARAACAYGSRMAAALFPQARLSPDRKSLRCADLSGRPPRNEGSCVIHLRGPRAGWGYDHATGECAGPIDLIYHSHGTHQRRVVRGSGPARAA